MGAILNESKMAQPYLNGTKLNAMLNGKKIWASVLTLDFVITAYSGVGIGNKKLICEWSMSQPPSVSIDVVISIEYDNEMGQDLEFTIEADEQTGAYKAGYYGGNVIRLYCSINPSSINGKKIFTNVEFII